MREIFIEMVDEMIEKKSEQIENRFRRYRDQYE